jgi:hypothetical protein
LLVGVDGSCAFTASVASGMLHRRGFLASLARRHLLYRPIDGLLIGRLMPVVQSISPAMIRDDY